MAQVLHNRHEGASLVLRPDLSEIARVRRLIEEIAPGLGFSSDRILYICIAASEAAANAIEHARETGQVRVEVKALADRLEVSVLGTGEFRLPAQVYGREHSGLGLPLMAKFSDHLALYAVADGGTLVTLTFYLPGHTRHSEEPMPPGQVELRQDRDFFLRVLDAIPVPVAYVDSHLVYRTANRAALAASNKRPEEVVDRPVSEVLKESPEIANLMEEAWRSGENRFQQRPRAAESSSRSSARSETNFRPSSSV